MFAQQPILVEILVEPKIVSLRTLSTDSSSTAKSCHLSATFLLSVILYVRSRFFFLRACRLQSGKASVPAQICMALVRNGTLASPGVLRKHSAEKGEYEGRTVLKSGHPR